MTDEPNSRDGRNGRFDPFGHFRDDIHDAEFADEAFPPALQPLARRLSADGARWQSDLPDPISVAERIRAIPATSPQYAQESDIQMSTQFDIPLERGQRPPRWDERPPRQNPRRGILAAIAAVLVVGLLAAVLVQFAQLHSHVAGTPTPAQPQPTQPQPAPTMTSTTYPVLVFFSKNPDSYNDPSAVFPVRRVAPAPHDATYAIQQLIAGPTPSEAAAGYFTELTGALSGASNCNGADFTLTLNMRGSTPQTGWATLQFCRATSLAGDMSGPRIKAEIKKTLTQFPAITSVVILTYRGQCFDDLRGGNGCLQSGS